MSRRLLAPGAAREYLSGKWRARAAVRQARRIRRLPEGSTVVCWDLDNTLVNSGSMLRLGRRLDEAIVEAEPVANMLQFYEALHEELPGARHVILSARTPAMRGDTLAWLERHRVVHDDDTVWFVPYAAAKPKVWSTLARVASLVIVDDLSYDHESEQPSVYADLVRSAEQTAAAYVGLGLIARIAADAGEVDAVVNWTIASLRRGMDSTGARRAGQRRPPKAAG